MGGPLATLATLAPDDTSPPSIQRIQHENGLFNPDGNTHPSNQTMATLEKYGNMAGTFANGCGRRPIGCETLPCGNGKKKSSALHVRVWWRMRGGRGQDESTFTATRDFFFWNCNGIGIQRWGGGRFGSITAEGVATLIATNRKRNLFENILLSDSSTTPARRRYSINSIQSIWFNQLKWSRSSVPWNDAVDSSVYGCNQQKSC